MNILDYIENIKQENEGPRITAQERRIMADGGRIGYENGQLVRNTADGSRPGYQGPGKGSPGIPKHYKTKMSQLYTPEVRQKIIDTSKKKFQKTPVGERLQWIADNGKNYESPLAMKKAYEKHFKHTLGTKADALFYTVKGGVGVSVDLGVGNREVLKKRIYLDQTDNLINPSKQKRNVVSFTKKFSEDELFKASIIQNNPKVKKKFIDLFADINKNAGTYAELGPEEMVLKLKSKGGYLLDGYEKGGFDFLFSYPRPGDSSQTIGGVHRGITRNTLINAGIPVEHIKSFQLVRKPLESIEKILRKVSTNPNYAKKVWGVGSGTSQKIANQLNNFLEGQKEARKIVRDLDTMFIKGQMNKEGYKGTVDSYLKTDAGKASSYNFTKVFGGVQFDHTLAKSIGRDYKYLPRNYLLKGQFTTGKFNRIKKDIFDLPLINMLKKHKEGKISGEKIKNFIDDFNKKTGGYADFTFDEKKGKIVYPQEKKVIYDLSRYSNPEVVAKELEKNIKMTMSDAFQKGYKGIIPKEDLKGFKSKEAKQILSNFWCGKQQSAAGGGRIGFSGSCSVEVKQKNFLRMTNDVANRKITGEAAEQIAKNAGKVVAKAGSKSALASIFGPAGIGIDLAYEVGSIGFDMAMDSNVSLKGALQNNWLTGAFIPGTGQEEYNKGLVKFDSRAKPMATIQNLIEKIESEEKNLERIKTNLVRGDYTGEAKKEILAKQEEVIKNLYNDFDKVARKKTTSPGHPEGEQIRYLALEEGSPERVAHAQAKQEYDSIGAARTSQGQDRGIDITSSIDQTMAPEKEILGKYTSEAKGPTLLKRTSKTGFEESLKSSRAEPWIDFSLLKNPQYGKYSKRELDQRLKVFGDYMGYGWTPYGHGYGMQQMKPGIGDMKYNKDLGYRQIAEIMADSESRDRIAEAGGISKLAGGGMVGDKSGPPPESGPMSQGLRSLYNNVRKR